MIATPQDGGSSLMERIAAEPALVQLVLVLFVGGLAAAWVTRLARRVREARERAGTRDFLLGVEQALCGDVQGAVRRLEHVVRDDPGNATARLLHAELLTVVGRPAEAHREHVTLQRAFGSRAPRNEVGLARALLATGRPLDAAAAAARIRSDDLAALRVRFDAECAAGRDPEAAAAGARLAAWLPGGEERDAVRAAAAGSAERGAVRALREGRLEDAQHLLGVVRRTAGEGDAASVRLEQRIVHAERALRALPDPGGDHDAESAALVHVGGQLGAALPDPLRFEALDSPGRVLDAIEANRRHIERLCRAVADTGDADAIDELVELGPEAAEEMLAQAIARGPDDGTFAEVFAAIGAAIVPALVDAWSSRRARGREGAGSRERAIAVLARILSRLGPDARTELGPLLASDDRALRKALIDYHLALCDPEAFGEVVELLPPVEVVQRMNEVSDDLLVPFLRCLPEGHFALDVLLPDGGFTRDVAVLDAIPGSATPAALERLVARRGDSQALVTALVERLADPRLAAVARRLLDGFGARALPTLVMAFADLDRPEPVRRAVGERLVQAGPKAVQPLCRCFGATPTPLDSDVMDVIVGIGDAAVPEVREAYRQGGLLERVAGPFARRRTHRREMLVWTLCGIGTLSARTTLAALREKESDADLTLRLAQAVHRIDERGPRVERGEPGKGRTGHGG